METTLQSQNLMEQTGVLEWALANRTCKITAVPHWVIMALLEDMAHCDCHLTEQLVTALDECQAWVSEDGYLERTIQKFMNNVLLASLYEDGHVEDSQSLLAELGLFDFHHDLEVEISLTTSQGSEQGWEESSLFEGTAVSTV